MPVREVPVLSRRRELSQTTERTDTRLVTRTWARSFMPIHSDSTLARPNSLPPNHETHETRDTRYLSSATNKGELQSFVRTVVVSYKGGDKQSACGRSAPDTWPCWCWAWTSRTWKTTCPCRQDTCNTRANRRGVRRGEVGGNKRHTLLSKQPDRQRSLPKKKYRVRASFDHSQNASARSSPAGDNTDRYTPARSRAASSALSDDTGFRHGRLRCWETSSRQSSAQARRSSDERSSGIIRGATHNQAFTVKVKRRKS